MGSEMCIRDSCGAVNYDGMLPQDTAVKAREVRDGMSKTAMIGERWYQMRVWTAGVYFSSHPGGGWATEAPKGPIRTACLSASKNIDSRYGINSDLDSVGYYRSHDNETDRPTAPPNAAKTLAFNDLPFGSFHTGGANFCYADVSVHFLTDGTDPQVLMALASRRGGEIVEE